MTFKRSRKLTGKSYKLYSLRKTPDIKTKAERMNMDLKELLGDELYAQVDAKLAEVNGADDR